MNKYIIPVLAVVVLALAFSTCDLGGSGSGEQGGGATVTRAAMPAITQQPADKTYFVGDTVQPLSVAITPISEEGSTVTYQWYSNSVNAVAGGAAVDGATAATFTPDISTATAGAAAYYYVTITNSNPGANEGYRVMTVNSKVVKVTVIADLTAGKTANATVTISAGATDRAQYVRGFGGMNVSWSAFPGMTMDDMDMMFNPDKLGYNMMRIMIMPDNIDIETTMNAMMNLEAHTKDDGIDDGPLYYDFVKLVNKYNGYVLASPWSPPAEWKTTGDISGYGSLKQENWFDYADYLFNFARHMYNKGAPIYVISIQNEPNYRDEYDGCQWTDVQMRDFFKRVGRFTTGVKGWGGGKEIPTVLTMNGESANTVNINNAALNDAEASAFIDVIGRHVYGSTLGRYALALNQGKEVWMTEHNINSNNATAYVNDSTYDYIWKFMNDVDQSIRLNDESAFIWWAMKRFYSFIGDGQYSTTNGVVLPRGYGLSHYAKFASEMYRTKVEVTGTTGAGAAVSTSGTGANVNANTFSQDSLFAKVTAFVSADGNTVSLVMFTPTNVSGASGVNFGTMKIQLPEGFVANGAVAMRSTSANAGQPVWEDVALSADRNSAFVDLPAGNILSVKFTK